MTNEEKQLLLKDLCARLPYGVKGHYKYYDIIGGRECLADENDGNITSIDVVLGNPIKINGYYIEVEYIKPYLRPMSSMTEEEIKIYQSLQDTACSYHYEFGDIVDDFLYFDNDVSLDYLNSIHIDYRGLIPMGLAIEAKEGIYTTE